MATQPISDERGRLVTVEEYLSTAYEPNCGFDDGVIVERNVGQFDHSYLQTILGALFSNNMESWSVFALIAQRVKVSSRKYLTPDVCVLRLGAPTEDILTHPPLIVIEIMSPEDTIRRATQKAAQYARFGVEHIWIIDPSARVAYRGTCSGLDLVPNGELRVADTPIIVRIAELFEMLDRIRAR